VPERRPRGTCVTWTRTGSTPSFCWLTTRFVSQTEQEIIASSGDHLLQHTPFTCRSFPVPFEALLPPCSPLPRPQPPQRPWLRGPLRPAHRPARRRPRTSRCRQSRARNPQRGTSTEQRQANGGQAGGIGFWPSRYPLPPSHSPSAPPTSSSPRLPLGCISHLRGIAG
jgi:hypothetical protein